MRSFILRGTITGLLTLTGVFSSLNSLQAQARPTRFNEILMTDLGGTPLYIKTDYVIEGSPYFPEEHMKTTIILKSGKPYQTVNSRINFYDNTLIMLRDDGVEQLLSGGISRVIYEMVPVNGKLRTVVFQKGFPAIDNLDSTIYYEVLDSGKLKLLKYSRATYSDKRGYGEASYTRVFTKIESYFIVSPGNIIRRLEKGKEEFLSVLPDKKKELEKYIDNKKIKCKKEEEWIELVSYYNNL